MFSSIQVSAHLWKRLLMTAHLSPASYSGPVSRPSVTHPIFRFRIESYYTALTASIAG
jgi:hypothetical protein